MLYWSLVNIYQLPDPCNVLFNEFQEFLAFLKSLTLTVIIAGDFKTPFENGFSDALAMNYILDMSNLIHHGNFPTH